MKIIPAKPKKRSSESVEILPLSDALMRKALVVDGTYEQAAEPAIRRAQAMIARVRDQFRRALPGEVEQLSRVFADYLAAPDPSTHHVVAFRAAHDLRGTAASLDEPLVARIAQSLARLMSHGEMPPKPLVRGHVDALRAVLRDPNSPVASELAAELERRTQATIDDGKRGSGGGQ
jgi:hypothetical protein